VQELGAALKAQEYRDSRTGILQSLSRNASHCNATFQTGKCILTVKHILCLYLIGKLSLMARSTAPVEELHWFGLMNPDLITVDIIHLPLEP